MKTNISLQNLRRRWVQDPTDIHIPDLLDLQKQSYAEFLQYNSMPEKRRDVGIQAALQSIFPVQDPNGQFRLEFIRYYFESPKFNVQNCLERNFSYTAALRVVLRFFTYDVDPETGQISVRDVKEQDIFFSEIPLMTKNGTFVINGTERVVVSQLHRSPGVMFDSSVNKTAGNFLVYSAHLIPARGSWIDFDIENKNIIYVRIDRRRKLPITTLLMTLNNEHDSALRAQAEKENKPLKVSDIKGYSKSDILHLFYKEATFNIVKEGFIGRIMDVLIPNVRLVFPLYNPKTGEKILKRGQRISEDLLKKLEKESNEFLVKDTDFYGHYFANDIKNDSGKNVVRAGEEITKEILEELKATSVSILLTDFHNRTVAIRNTCMVEKNEIRNEALLDLQRVMNPGSPFNLELADSILHRLFFSSSTYDLQTVGRYKINVRLYPGEKNLPTERVLSNEDIFRTVNYLLDIQDGKGVLDDIDSLADRRIRSVGELLANQFWAGLARMEKSVREQAGNFDVNITLPKDILNAKSLSSVIREFFNSSQLSQFMDQTNPVSEITHKRRLSAMGPGGLSRERAGFEVRDIHPTHYGRICPIETPEGPNIGLINSLALYAKVNKYGLIETPYRKVKDGKMTDEIKYMSAIDETGHTIAEANTPILADGSLGSDLVSCRHNFENMYAIPQNVDYIEISPLQLISAAAALIPFLEHDDANRALMGANMQRQAVPLLNPEAPLVGTGLEKKMAIDSNSVVTSKTDGVVYNVDSRRITIKLNDPKDGKILKTYYLRKFERSNQNTCINQRPIVDIGDHIKAGDVIADGVATDGGELALGRNVLVAFMPWQGYNFEDSILLSDRIIKDDVFTSIHIEKYEVVARDTKLGPEEITRDIPAVSPRSIRNLDETGIVYEGAHVESGDILVGKVTPKGESVLTAEEKLLMAIFGEKASDIQNTSLVLPPEQEGTVVSVQILNRDGTEKDERSLLLEQEKIRQIENDGSIEIKVTDQVFSDKVYKLLDGQTLAEKFNTLTVGTVLSKPDFISMPFKKLVSIQVKNAKVTQDIQKLKDERESVLETVLAKYKRLIDIEKMGSDMPLGVLKTIRVYVAVKRKIQPGDKMAGRHGNKGVVSRILAAEDMPYLADGRPMDIVLNPLGVPSRMNLGQILETHVGWATAELGQQVGRMLRALYKNQVEKKDVLNTLAHVYEDDSLTKLDEEEGIKIAKRIQNGISVACPAFNGLSDGEISHLLKHAGLHESGQVTLWDGRTGEPFARPVTVGYIYMLKLNHLVDDKIHARSVGPYSFVTQQPLGGKSQFGGQRFGEMEVWALEGYGAAYTLLEMQTYKSDFIEGRTKVFDFIVQGRETFVSGIPESFKVLVKEIQGLGLNVDLKNNTEDGKNNE